MRGATVYVVEVRTRGQWRKVRGAEGGPWNTRDRAERIAEARESATPRGLSSTEGLPHRVTERRARRILARNLETFEGR